MGPRGIFCIHGSDDDLTKNICSIRISKMREYIIEQFFDNAYDDVRHITTEREHEMQRGSFISIVSSFAVLWSYHLENTRLI